MIFSTLTKLSRDLIFALLFKCQRLPHVYCSSGPLKRQILLKMQARPQIKRMEKSLYVSRILIDASLIVISE